MHPSGEGQTMRQITIFIFLSIAVLFACSENNTVENWIQKEQQLWDGQKYEEPQKAIQYLNNAIILQPNNAELYSKRGTAYYNTGNYQRTVEDDSEAIRLAPEYAEAYNNRAGAYVKLRQFQSAVRDYDQAIALKPDSAIFYNNRAVVYLLQGKKDPGCRDAIKACDLGDCVTLEEARIKKYCR